MHRWDEERRGDGQRDEREPQGPYRRVVRLPPHVEGLVDHRRPEKDGDREHQVVNHGADRHGR